ncbi:hypothetical protein BH23BAC4_BH23BAC4_06860 [soil metagenome]
MTRYGRQHPLGATTIIPRAVTLSSGHSPSHPVLDGGGLKRGVSTR